MRLDGDAALPLQVHGVQNLIGHFALGERPCSFQEPIGQRRLAVVDMGDDGKIAYMALIV